MVSCVGGFEFLHHCSKIRDKIVSRVRDLNLSNVEPYTSSAGDAFKSSLKETRSPSKIIGKWCTCIESPDGNCFEIWR